MKVAIRTCTLAIFREITDGRLTETEWNVFKVNTCVRRGGGQWHYGSKHFYKQEGYTITYPFELYKNLLK